MILWKSKLLAASIPNQQVLSAAILESWLHWSLKIYTGMFSVTTHRASSILAQEDKNRHFWASSAQVNFQLKAFFVIGSTVLFSIHSSHAIPVVFLFILRRLTNYYVLLNVRQGVDTVSTHRVLICIIIWSVEIKFDVSLKICNSW